jgi:hypothetical protein
MTTAFQSNAFQNNAFQIEPEGIPPSGLRPRKSAIHAQQERRRKEDDEMAMILQAVMPLVAAQETQKQEITLGDRNGEQQH